MNSKTYDMDGLYKHFHKLEKTRLIEQVRKKTMEDAYYDGYMQAMDDVRQIMDASNYKVEDESEGEG